MLSLRESAKQFSVIPVTLYAHFSHSCVLSVYDKNFFAAFTRLDKPACRLPTAGKLTSSQPGLRNTPGDAHSLDSCEALSHSHISGRTYGISI